jgi:hypothetical protein
MRSRCATWLGLALMSIGSVSTAVDAQTITIVDGGPRAAARELRAALARPHRLIVGQDTLLQFPRDSAVTETLIIVGAPRVTVASRVEGSVIVIGGDLFLHPGVAITGDAIAYGGGVYTSMLGSVGGRTIGYRDFTFDVAQVATGHTLTYRELSFSEFRPIELPGLYGVRIPSYDRVNGLSIPFGPRFWFDGTRYSIEPIVTYRSDLGEIDPELRATMSLQRGSAIELTARRTTLTNDGWIRGSFINSLTSLFAGRDVRNYWRADRGELRYRFEIEQDRGILTPFVGGATERGWSVAPAVGATSAPWSVLGRDDAEEGMRRPNPPVTRGRISSLFVGSGAAWQIDDVSIDANTFVEVAPTAPDDRRFAQATLGARFRFPALRNHTFQSEVHSVLTFGDTAPPQRFVYLGGSGTLPTRLLLSMGGDQLLFFESVYTVPIEQISVKFLGSPAVSLRHMIGAAGVDRLPGFVNNLGVRVTLSLFKVDYVIDPETGDTDVSFGLSFAR